MTSSSLYIFDCIHRPLVFHYLGSQSLREARLRVIDDIIIHRSLDAISARFQDAKSYFGH